MFLQHSYNIKNKPNNWELEKYFHESHNINDNLDVTVSKNNIKTVAAQKYHTDEWICTLKNLGPHDLSTAIGNYAKEMYNIY